MSKSSPLLTGNFPLQLNFDKHRYWTASTLSGMQVSLQAPVNPQIPSLAQSENKTKFLDRLCISSDSDHGRRIYQLMKVGVQACLNHQAYSCASKKQLQAAQESVKQQSRFSQAWPAIPMSGHHIRTHKSQTGQCISRRCESMSWRVQRHVHITKRAGIRRVAKKETGSSSGSSGTSLGIATVATGVDQ